MTNEEHRSVRNAERQINGVTRTPLRVHLTRSERALLEAKAKILGWSLSRTLVQAALKPTQADTIENSSLDERIEELRLLRRQLTGVATNLNQIARHANTVDEIPAEFPALMQELHRLIFEVNSLLLDVQR